MVDSKCKRVYKAGLTGLSTVKPHFNLFNHCIFLNQPGLNWLNQISFQWKYMARLFNNRNRVTEVGGMP